MRQKKLIMVMVIFCLLAFGFMIYQAMQTDNSPGEVIGDNAKHLPKQALPICEFDGSKYIDTPCYSPPGSKRH